PSSTASHRYLPRRSARLKVRPFKAASNPAGPAASRRTARGCSTWTSAMVRPTTWACRPMRTVSTSGSSGTTAPALALAVRRGLTGRHFWRHLVGVAIGIGRGGTGTVSLVRLRLGGDRAPGRLRGQLLSRLLRAALPRAELPVADPDQGAERLLVIGAAVLHH